MKFLSSTVTSIWLLAHLFVQAAGQACPAELLTITAGRENGDPTFIGSVNARDIGEFTGIVSIRTENERTTANTGDGFNLVVALYNEDGILQDIDRNLSNGLEQNTDGSLQFTVPEVTPGIYVIVASEATSSFANGFLVLGDGFETDEDGVIQFSVLGNTDEPPVTGAGAYLGFGGANQNANLRETGIVCFEVLPFPEEELGFFESILQAFLDFVASLGSFVLPF